MRKHLFLLLFIILCACDDATTDEAILTADKSEYVKLAIGSNTDNTINKWDFNFSVFLDDSIKSQGRFLYQETINEINSLSDDFQIQSVDNVNQAHLKIYWTDRYRFQIAYPEAKNFLNENHYYTDIIANGNRILGAAIFIDTARIVTNSRRSRIFKREFLKVLGLVNQVEQYPTESVFGNFSYYSDLDYKLIYYHLNSAIKPGMTRSEVRNVLKDL